MCWPENDASEKNKANTGEVSKSISCAASKAIPPFAQASNARSPGLRYDFPGMNWLYMLAILLLCNVSDYCLNWIDPIEVKQLIAVQCNLLFIIVQYNICSCL